MLRFEIVILTQIYSKLDVCEVLNRVESKRLCTARRTPRPEESSSFSRPSSRKTLKSEVNNSLL